MLLVDYEAYVLREYDILLSIVPHIKTSILGQALLADLGGKNLI